MRQPALKTPRDLSFDPPKFGPGESYPAIGDHIHHQGHLLLQRVGGSGGALYGCYELFGHHAAPMRVHRQAKAHVFLLRVLCIIPGQSCNLERSWNYVNAL